MPRSWDTTQNFFLAFTDKLEKPIFIKKLFKWANKNKITLIFTMFHFLNKNKEKHLEIPLFYTRVPKISII